jgi:DNA-directed RNA polymerase specialized sigma subunit
MIYIENKGSGCEKWKYELFRKLRFFSKSRVAKYSSFGRRDDLIQESDMALWKCINSFDYKKNFDFYRWAHWNISSGIKNFLSSDSSFKKSRSNMSDYVYNGQSCEYTASVSDALVAKDLMTGPILSEREKFVLHDLVVMGIIRGARSADKRSFYYKIKIRLNWGLYV